PIVLPVALPAEHIRFGALAGLGIQPGVRQAGSTFDIAKGTPQRVARLALERFRRRGYEGLRNRHSLPHWPARSGPGLLALAAQSPHPYATHEPDREGAVTMYRALAAPAPHRVLDRCALMHWGTQPPPRPGSIDWDRAPHLAAVAQPLPFVLPVDSLG